MTEKFQIKTLLIIGAVWPEPDSSAAGQRMMQLIELFQSEGWEITFASTASGTPYMADLERKQIRSVAVKMNDPEFDAFIQELQPSVVIFDRFMVEEQFGWRVAESCPEAVRILDTEDLHCLRRARRKALRQESSYSTEDLLLQDDVAKREIASIYRCDLSLIISEAEMQLLKDFFQVPSELLLYVPFLLDSIPGDVTRWPAFSERNHFITVGNFRHPPNWDAVLFLKQHIWPLLRHKVSRAELHIYGAYPSRKVQQLHKPEEGFFIKGRVSDSKAAVREARLCLAPLRFGAGLKGKLIEAMQCGTPSVTTTIGAEGMAGDYPWPGRIADGAEELARAAAELYTNQPLWEEVQRRGIPIINQRFSKHTNGPDFLKRIQKLQCELQTHRRKNFTGAMLHHHTMASTKYMSRWIEAKNSKNQ